MNQARPVYAVVETTAHRFSDIAMKLVQGLALDLDADAETRRAGEAEKGVETVSESDFELVEGSGNIFRNLGDPDADLKQAKAILAARIVAVLDERGLSVRKAAALTRFAAADFSRIRNADLGRFTLDRLMKMLAALDDRLRATRRVDAAQEGEPAMAGSV